MPFLPDSDGCFVCGRLNSAGFGVRFRVDGTEVSATFTADKRHCSYAGVVHGGVLSALLDETMGWAPSYLKKHFCYAAELRVRFIRPAPVGVRLLFAARVTLDRGRLAETSGEVTDADGTVYARSWGKYVPMAAEDARAVIDYLHFDEGTVSRDELVPSESPPEYEPADDPGSSGV